MDASEYKDDGKSLFQKLRVERVILYLVYILSLCNNYIPQIIEI